MCLIALLLCNEVYVCLSVSLSLSGCRFVSVKIYQMVVMCFCLVCPMLFLSVCLMRCVCWLFVHLLVCVCLSMRLLDCLSVRFFLSVLYFVILYICQPDICQCVSLLGRQVAMWKCALFVWCVCGYVHCCVCVCFVCLFLFVYSLVVCAVCDACLSAFVFVYLF